MDTTLQTTYDGPTIYTAVNPITGRLERVYPESEIPPDQMVIPMFWVQSANIYVTVPGTEVYGYIPDPHHTSD